MTDGDVPYSRPCLCQCHSTENDYCQTNIFKRYKEKSAILKKITLYGQLVKTLCHQRRSHKNVS